MSAFDRLWERSSPRFGELCRVVLLVTALILASLPYQPIDGVRIGPATIISFLPDGVLGSRLCYELARWTLIVCSVAWLLHRWVPWTGWLTSLSFTLVWSLRMENTDHAAHIFNVANMLLIVHAGWFHVARRQMREAWADGRYWDAPLYPNWVFTLSVFYIAWFHMWAGLTKLRYSGIDWGNGLSLQLWIHLWGWPGSPLGQLVLSNRTLARLAQSGALLIETSSILAIGPKGLRWFVGVNLFGFYAGVLITFVDYGFHFNAILVALFLLPVREWMERFSRPAIVRHIESAGLPEAPDSPRRSG